MRPQINILDHKNLDFDKIFLFAILSMANYLKMRSRLYLLLVDFLSGIGGPARPAPSLPHCLPLRRPLSRPGFPLMMDKNEGERGCPYAFLPLLVRPIKGRKKRLFPSSFSSQEALERTPGHTLGDEATTRLEMISRRNHKKSCVCG